MRRREHDAPKHAAPSCGVAWCRDPRCGVARAVEQRSALAELATIVVSECRAVRRARLSSTPRRVATRFGLSLLVTLGSLTAVVDTPAAALEDGPGAGVAGAPVDHR